MGRKLSVLVAAVVLGMTIGIGRIYDTKVSATTRTIGQDRIISRATLPPTSGDDEVCEFVVASAAPSSSVPAATALQRRGGGGAGTVQPTGAAAGGSRAVIEKRAPLYVMTDPDYAFSAVTVDQVRNEVILMDQNKSHVLVFDRLENTAPSALRSQPKRIIGGDQTFLEYASSVYVDPANGDIYAINNDTMNWMPVFGREAQGNIRPKRVLSTPHTTYGIAGNEATREIFITDQDDHAVLIFDKDAHSENGDPTRRPGRQVEESNDTVAADPKRILQGPRTGLADPHGVAVDPRTDELFVSNWGTSNARPTLEAAVRSADEKRRFPVFRMQAIPGSGKVEPPSITVYAKSAKSDTAPVRTIRGPKTQLNWPTALALHPERGELFVANDPTDSVLVFPIGASGDVAPIRVLKGARSLIKNPIGLAVDTKNNELWVANFGNHSATVYPIDAKGDPAPLRIIRSAPLKSPAPMLSNAHSAVFDPNRDEVLVANCVGHPSIAAFPRQANGSVNPLRAISGQRTLISRTIHDMAYDPIHDEIVAPAWYTFGIITFRGGDAGDVAPTRIIHGPKTQIKNAEAVAIDPIHEEIFVPSSALSNQQNTRDRVLVFRRTDNGDVAPIRILEGPDTGLSMGRVTVDGVNNVLIASGRGGLRIFDRTASGNVKPRAIIKGGGGDLMTTYPPKGLIFTARAGPGGRYDGGDHIAVWSIHDDGDDPPRWEIGKDVFYDIRGVTIDPKSKTVMATDKKLNAIVTFHVPEIFDEELSTR